MATPKKKKAPKMDRKLVSKQKHEIKHEAKKLGVSEKKIREVQKTTRSRKQIEKKISWRDK